ncbi:hypothetical protein [Massilia psychrophila]|uniref:hypothetical protein n=1 Tax=Massilia psychrophila TaxID=1603353 RepID=UPI0015D4BADE|nr:hypothetical protein [Massilia psychrophila]
MTRSQAGLTCATRWHHIASSPSSASLAVVGEGNYLLGLHCGAGMAVSARYVPSVRAANMHENRAPMKQGQLALSLFHALCCRLITCRLLS